uniref:Uncharacterized protein n=1 Tax=Pararge aegeria TaxID=116150 RepID=S4NYI7_9NEOP
MWINICHKIGFNYFNFHGIKASPSIFYTAIMIDGGRTITPNVLSVELSVPTYCYRTSSNKQKVNFFF